MKSAPRPYTITPDGFKQKWPKGKFTVLKQQRMINKEARRLKRLAYKAARRLQRIKRILARQAARAANLETHQSVKALKAAKRRTAQRVRSTDEVGEVPFLDPITWYRNSVGVVTGIGHWAANGSVSKGMRKMIVDYHPILKLSPPRNATTIGSFRVNSLKAGIDLVPAIKSRPIHREGSSYWPGLGLQNHGILTTMPQQPTFNMTYGNMALQKAIARVYEADINGNEYFVEWKQVAKLLRDPFKTVVSFHKTLKHWVGKDAWMWIPHRRARKFGDGLLISEVPLGGVLMSMRTRKVIDPIRASNEVVNAACNRWLQYRYGIAPLMSDLTKVFELWMEPIRPPGLRSCSARHWVQRPTKVNSTYVRRLGPFDLTFKRVYQKGEFYSSKVWYQMNIDEVPWSYKTGMHPSQFLNIIWNSLPYSFIADWVFNVDQWLTSQREVPWIQLMANVVTHKTFEKFSSTCVSATDITYLEKAVITGSPVATVNREVIDRKIDLPRPVELFYSQAWQSVKNVMTAQALILSPILNESLKSPSMKR